MKNKNNIFSIIILLSAFVISCVNSNNVQVDKTSNDVINGLGAPVTVVSKNWSDTQGCYGTLSDGDGKLYTLSHSMFCMTDDKLKVGDIIKK